MDADASLMADSLRGVVALAAVLGLLLLLAWGLRRAGVVRGAVGSGPLAVAGSLALDGRNRVVLLRCADRQHLLAVGPAGVSLLASGAAPPPTAELPS